MSAGDAIASVTRSARLVVCLGPGGVGKTTVSAALAVRAASEGRRVFLLTIDPARRLADALSISLDDEESAVPLDDEASSVPIAGGGTLHAAMLETRASWDAFVARIARERGARARILENRVYQAFSRTLARSHAYVAMERLHHALAERDPAGRPRWDLVVLDTPPTRSALDVLDAPASLARFADERVVGALGAGRVLGAPGARAARRALGWIMGPRLAGELAAFLDAFAPMRAGFAARSREVHAQLAAESTVYVLVTAPFGAALEDARYLAGDLARRGLALEALVVNRAFHTDPLEPRAPLAHDGPRADEARARALIASAPGGSEEEARAVLEEARAARRRALADDARAAALALELDAGARARRTWMLAGLPSEPCTPAALDLLVQTARPL